MRGPGIERHGRGRGENRDGIQDGDVLVDGYCGIVDAGDGELDDVAWSGNDGGSGVSDGAVGIGDRGAHRGVASGDAVDLEGDAGVGGAGDHEAEVEELVTRTSVPSLGWMVRTTWPGPTGTERVAELAEPGLGLLTSSG